MAAPTRAKQRLGKYLRDLRVHADVQARDVATELKSTPSTIGRYETGHVLPVWGTVLALMAYYGATDDDRQEVSRLYDVAADEPAPVRLPANAPKAFRRLVNAERDGAAELVIEPFVVPGLLQTEDYAHAINAVASRYVSSDDDVQVRGYVAVRLNRQRRLDGRQPLTLHALIDESVIYRMVGSPAIMRHQLQHLLTMVQRSHVTVQVVPYGAGAYGTMSGSCAIVKYDDDTADVYLEYAAGGAWVENPRDIGKFTTMFEDVVNVALTSDQSIELVSARVRALEEQ